MDLPRFGILLTAILPLILPGSASAQGKKSQRQTVAGSEWAKPAELRSKKLIDAGIYTLDSKLNSRWLAEHPEFTTTHPFDGLAVRLPLDAEWCKKEGIPPATYLDELAWSTKPVPYKAVMPAIADLKRTRWGQLTDNFLWWTLRGGVKNLRGDLEIDNDWKAIENNAKLAARVCKEANMKGLLFDTEQYGSYLGTKLPYPFGKAKGDVLKARGRAWIKAVQQECPDMKIMFTFAWAPDLDAAEFLAGVKGLINGMLDGIEGKGLLIHGYENTFYYGQIAGSRFTKDGFRGDRARYDEAVVSMRQWSSYSSDAKKFDKHVRVGMAAWLESDPWNLWSGWPSGTRDTIWSNLPLALATSEEYVWCWSEHTNFLHNFTDNVPGVTGLNPFLASLTNQTFNTGNEGVTKLTEDFATDPLAKGWYFDFNMLDVGRKRKPKDSGLIMPADAVPYRWVPNTKCLQVGNAWTRPPDGKSIARHENQRRRFVHPISEAGDNDIVHAEFEFEVDRFGEDPANPMILGMFHSERAANSSSLMLRISGIDSVAVMLAGDEGTWESKPVAGLKAGHKYRFKVVLNGQTRKLDAQLTNLSIAKVMCELRGDVPTDVKGFRFDEVGIAQPDWIATETGPDKSHTYHVTRVRYEKELPPRTRNP